MSKVAATSIQQNTDEGIQVREGNTLLAALEFVYVIRAYASCHIFIYIAKLQMVKTKHSRSEKQFVHIAE